MAALTFFAYASLGLGPGIVFFIFFIAPKSFLVLLSLFSAFTWLAVLLFTSAVFRGFVPIAQQQVLYAGMLIFSVCIQEAARYGVWRMHRKTVSVLKAMAASNGHRFWLVDQLYMAMAWGYGHAACHTVFFFASFLPLTGASGTFYLDSCPSMSLFLVGALYSLAFGMILTSLMVISLDGFESGSWLKVVFAPLMHAGASLATLGNFKQDGCNYVMPFLLATGVVNVLVALKVAWDKGTRQAS